MIYDVMMGDVAAACFEDGELNIVDADRVPIFLKNTRDFHRWVSERAIDASRTNSRHLKRSCGLSPHASDFDSAMFVHAACVTDNFWVKERSETLSWSDVKQDSDAFFRMAALSDSSDMKPSKNPELTNIGSQEKGWRLIDGKWWLCKNERIEEQGNEFLTYRIGKAMGFDMAEYRIEDGLIYTRDFTEGAVNLQHADSFLFDHEENGRKVFDEDEDYSYRTLLGMGEDLAGAYLDIICLDAVMNNTDRHTKNYGVLTSQTDGHIIKLAPNYDNDQSLYGYSQGQRSRALAKRFIKLLEENDLTYGIPYLDEEMVRKMTEDDELTEYIIGNYDMIAESGNVIQMPMKK